MSVRRKEQIYASCLYQIRTWGDCTCTREIKHGWNADTHTFQIYIEHHLQYANANFSFQMRKCRNSITGQSSITLQSSSVWIMVTVTERRRNPKAQPSIIGHCLPLKQHGLVGSVGWGCCVRRCRSAAALLSGKMSERQEGERQNAFSRHRAWRLAFSHWYSLFVSSRQGVQLTAVSEHSGVLPATCAMATYVPYMPPWCPW